ncbi:MAG: hypothetical protein JRC92_12140 [Deltaproteobacteria bacterium]|nr:hypothetical protein [Deltaproteobacteria bacterium]
MKRNWIILWVLGLLILLSLAACQTAYQAKPLPFQAPATMPNAVEAAGAVIGAQAYAKTEAAKEAFGFDVRGAGLLPVQVVFDNQGPNTLTINPLQTFLEDEAGNLWPVLRADLAYERAGRYAQTREIFKEGAYHGFLGAAAGAVIGAAVGVVTGDFGEAMGKGAAVGAAAGATMGGLGAYGENDAHRAIIADLKAKSLSNQIIGPGDLAQGFIFFPGEAKSARWLRLQIRVDPGGEVRVVDFAL